MFQHSFTAVRYVLLTTALLAQAQSAPHLEGDWLIAFRSADVAHSYVISLRPDGNGFSGFAQATTGGEKYPVTDVAVAGNGFSFLAAGIRIKGHFISNNTAEMKFVFARQDQIVTATRTPGLAEEINRQVFGVDQTKMGPYRALAKLAFDAVQSHDMERAGMYALILERCWDLGSSELQKSSKDIWRQIDSSMDRFVFPITNNKYLPLDPTQLTAAYQAYLQKLQLAD